MKEFILRDYGDHWVVFTPIGLKEIAENNDELLRALGIEENRMPKIRIPNINHKPDDDTKKRGNPFAACKQCRRRHNPTRECSKSNQQLAREELKKIREDEGKC